MPLHKCHCLAITCNLELVTWGQACDSCDFHGLESADIIKQYPSGRLRIAKIAGLTPIWTNS